MKAKAQPSRTIAIVEALATVAIWGATFVATKVALREVSPATIVWLRFSMGIVILGLAASFRNEISPPARRDWPLLVLLGFIGVAFHQWLQSNGLRTAAATTTAWLVATTPIFIALLGWMTLAREIEASPVGRHHSAALGVLIILGRGNLSGLLLWGANELR